MTVVFPDVMSDVQYWLRRHPDLRPLNGSRVFFRIPTQPAPTFPLQRIYRSGGTVRADTDAPLQDVLISIECWHNTNTGYQTLRQMVAATESAVWTLPSNTLINPNGTTLVVDAVVTNTIDSPDPDTGWPRFICDSRFTVIAS